MANLARKHKKYSDEIRYQIYSELNEGRHRFNDLAEKLGRNRVTLSEYLVHGEESGEIERTPRTREYGLTAKGRQELHKMKVTYALKVADCHYHEEIDSIGEIPEYVREGITSGRLLSKPLPMPVRVTIFGSHELRPVFGLYEDVIAAEDERSPKKSLIEFLKDRLQGLAEEFLWEYLDQHVSMLAESYEEAGGESAKKRPTLEDLLGFQLSMAIEYDGKRILADLGTDVKERRRIAKRFVGAILLGPASGDYDESDADSICLLQNAGLISERDAAEVIENLNKASSRTPIGFTNKERKALGEIAWRFLREGRVVDESNQQLPPRQSWGERVDTVIGDTERVLVKVTKELDDKERQHIMLEHGINISAICNYVLMLRQELLDLKAEAK